MAERSLSPLRRLSPESADGWRAFCAREGVTMSALAEALGLGLASMVEDGRPTPPWFRTIVLEARAIASSRRER
jgi:hypothetical protein